MRRLAESCRKDCVKNALSAKRRGQKKKADPKIRLFCLFSRYLPLCNSVGAVNLDSSEADACGAACYDIYNLANINA